MWQRQRSNALPAEKEARPAYAEGPLIYEVMVGLAGFEPTTSASRTQRSTKLSHSPSEERGYPTGVAGEISMGAPVASS
jgi:hypothetical protein